MMAADRCGCRIRVSPRDHVAGAIGPSRGCFRAGWGPLSGVPQWNRVGSSAPRIVARACVQAGPAQVH